MLDGGGRWWDGALRGVLLALYKRRRRTGAALPLCFMLHLLHQFKLNLFQTSDLCSHTSNTDNDNTNPREFNRSSEVEDQESMKHFFNIFSVFFLFNSCFICSSLLCLHHNSDLFLSSSSRRRRRQSEGRWVCCHSSSSIQPPSVETRSITRWRHTHTTIFPHPSDLLVFVGK